MSQPLKMEYLAAAVEVDDLPPTQSEVAFIGRSNVGKSSLLNALAGTKNMSFVSNTPGRTQTLTCFTLIGTRSTLVDCPDYGYAKVPKAQRKLWEPMLESYLTERENLNMVLHLVDGEIGPTKSDLEVLDWLRAEDIPHAIIATKLDKVRPSKRDRRKREFTAKCGVESDTITWVSVHKNIGLTPLRELVRDCVQ